MDRPGGALAKRPLQFIWIVDCSGSMCGKKIDSLNNAIREAIPPMRDTADQNPNAEVLVRVLTFSRGVQWQVSQPTEIHAFNWTDMQADGMTPMGAALEKVADALKVENMPERGLPPVLVLISDGQPTDDIERGLAALKAQPWGIKAVRIAIAIGDDADLGVLQKFIDNTEIKPLQAQNVQDLVTMIRWASTVPLKAASNPSSKLTSSGTANVVLPTPPPTPTNAQTIDPSSVF
jgi:uncharacterized protein YegL